MKSIIYSSMLSVALLFASFAQAQSCGSGGGTTVCLNASGESNNINLSWSVSGSVTRLEVYRDTDSNPSGRQRLSAVAASTRNYVDTTANAGTQYWYWIKFWANGKAYNSGAASASRSLACQTPMVVPYIQIGSTWSQAASATINPGAQVVLGPQPIAGNAWAAGTWSWSGCGTGGTSREQTITPSTSCTATATFTNTCGQQARSDMTLSITSTTYQTMQSGVPIVVDQFGYLPNQDKVAVIRDPQMGFDVNDSFTPGNVYDLVDTTTHQAVFSAPVVTWNNGETDASSGDRAWHFDFSSFTQSGEYYVRDTQRNVKSATFKIANNVYAPVLRAAVRTFFYQRAGQEKSAAHAGIGWADGASHVGPNQDRNARLYSAPHDWSTERDLSGGWYDAGDMNKYTAWTAGYVIDLLHAYLVNPSIWTDDYNIPESGNGVPDILDEVKWGLDWLSKMQESNGSVLSIVGVAHASPPSAATGPSYYGPASSQATISSAAAFALGAKVLGTVPAYSNYANGLRTRATNAWNWYSANPNVEFRNNDSANGSQGLGAGQQETGPETRFTTQITAAIYLYDATGNNTYRNFVDQNYSQTHVIQWGHVLPYRPQIQQALLHYTSLPTATTTTVSNVKNAYSGSLYSASYWGKVDDKTDPYMAHLYEYVWGSNAVKSIQGHMYASLALYGMSSNTRDANANLNAAANYLHYMHGVNPLNMVYLTNMGSLGAENSANEIFHSWFADGSARWDSVKTSTYGPPPGFIPGGPNSSSYGWDDRCPQISPLCGATLPSPPAGQPHQKSYKDFNDGWPLGSWSVTENSNGYQTAYIRLLANFVNLNN